MKKFYMLVAASFVAATSFGQLSYDLQLDLTTPASMSSVAPGNVSVEFDLTNNGPDAIPSGDTLFFSVIINPQLGANAEVFGLDGTTSNGADGIILPAAVPSGFTLTYAMMQVALGQITLDLSSRPAGTVVAIVCWGSGAAALSATGDTNETDDSNNIDAFLIGTVGIDGLESTSFSVFPNPATDVLNVTTTEEVASVSVYSVDGKISFNTIGGKVDVSSLNAGVYIYEATTVSGKKAINKFVKK